MEDPQPVDYADARRRLARGFREALLDFGPSPAVGGPIALRIWRRLGSARAAFTWLLAFGAFWIGMASIPGTHAVHDLMLPVLAALIALPVGLSGSHALLGWRLATALSVFIALVPQQPRELDLGLPWPALQHIVWLATVYLASVRHDRWTVVWVWITTVLVLSTTMARDDLRAGWIAGVTALVLVGTLFRGRLLAQRELARQEELSELEKARRTVLEERTRIARDLHDVVAHHMSMVVVQAESAPYRLTGLSEETRAEFASISGSAREALTEIRGLLGVLRSEDAAAARTPQPGLHQLDELVEGAARAGVPVTLTVTGRPGRIRAAVGLSAYRILQESLANAARHAPGAEVQVQVTYDDDALRLLVRNQAAATTAAVGSPGHGLTGMQERAAVVDGTLRAGPLPGGGFEVAAEMPNAGMEPA